ncbi:hypothetical protein E2C01_071305 [Portunus trituberculatus]|uniref:Transmembrane protein n=1 Tax=Portunus trituberculatus TaxID=210409 RepID=A0A5B7HWM6_PORTR|nr:hypothetical protein [Portunus trituberculatus]
MCPSIQRTPHDSTPLFSPPTHSTLLLLLLLLLTTTSPLKSQQVYSSDSYDFSLNYPGVHNEMLVVVVMVTVVALSGEIARNDK